MKKIFLLGLGLLLIASVSEAKLYRWVDESGEVHFSDKVPLRASKKAHSVINKHGLTTKNVDPEKLLEIEKNKQKYKLEQEEKERVVQQKRIAKAESRQRDRQLLLTYENVDELNQYFDNKIKLVKGNSDILISHNSRLTKKIEKLEDKKKRTNNKARETVLTFKIIDLNKTMRQYKRALDENYLEMARLNERHEETYQRFTELSQKNNH